MFPHTIPASFSSSSSASSFHWHFPCLLQRLAGRSVFCSLSKHYTGPRLIKVGFVCRTRSVGGGHRRIRSSCGSAAARQGASPHSVNIPTAKRPACADVTQAEILIKTVSGVLLCFLQSFYCLSAASRCLSAVYLLSFPATAVRPARPAAGIGLQAAEVSDHSPCSKSELTADNMARITSGCG